MRVIGGTAKGRELASVPGDSTRPILDRVKTALFDILRPTLPGATVLDLFGGSGAVGIEALSQGAASCVFVDVHPAAAKTIRENLETTKLINQAQIRQTDAFLYLLKTDQKFDLIFIAPPQYIGLWIQALQAIGEHPEVLKPDGQIVVQIDPKESESIPLTDFIETGQRKYGNTLLVFYGRTAVIRD